jgi:butyryl-CoA dehydrogenase
VIAFNILNIGRLKLGPFAVGGCKADLAISIKYAKERKAFGKSIGEFGMIQHKLAEMAIRLYASESMSYRVVGMIDAMLAGHSWSEPDYAARELKAVEEFAAECSYIKVYASEVLDYIVDEAVQIHGGYGFSQEYSVEHAYRDSRINRIFEGTNEINRMLIVQMLMKRAMGGMLQLIPAAMKLTDEVLAGPTFEEGPSGAFTDEQRALAQAKKIFLLAAGAAVQKFREQLAEQQEIVAALADVVMDVYAMESALLRAQKADAKKTANGALLAEAARVFIHDAMDRIEKQARTALAATAEGDTLMTQLAVLRRFAKHAAVDTIAARRRIAAAVLAQDRYPFSNH